jgi:hypothetical protein
MVDHFRCACLGRHTIVESAQMWLGRRIVTISQIWRQSKDKNEAREV